MQRETCVSLHFPRYSVIRQAAAKELVALAEAGKACNEPREAEHLGPVELAKIFAERADLAEQHAAMFDRDPAAAKVLVSELRGTAEEILNRGIELGRAEVAADRVSTVDAAVRNQFLSDVMFCRAELAVSMGEYELGAGLMAESAGWYSAGGLLATQMVRAAVRMTYYSHVRLLVHCLLGAGKPDEAMDALKGGASEISHYPEFGNSPEIVRAAIAPVEHRCQPVESC